MKDIIYQFRNINNACRVPRWMAFGYYSVVRNQILWVAFPLNLIVGLAWWIQDRWARAANAPSWIEREVQARVDHHIRSTTGIRRPRRLDDQF
jgi:hypothetical protein